MNRNPDGTLVRDPANPHGLGPMLTVQEREARLKQLLEVRDTADVAIGRVAEVRARSLRPEGSEPQTFGPYWWQDEEKP